MVAIALQHTQLWIYRNSKILVWTDCQVGHHSSSSSAISVKRATGCHLVTVCNGCRNTIRVFSQTRANPLHKLHNRKCASNLTDEDQSCHPTEQEIVLWYNCSILLNTHYVATLTEEELLLSVAEHSWNNSKVGRYSTCTAHKLLLFIVLIAIFQKAVVIGMSQQRHLISCTLVVLPL